MKSIGRRASWAGPSGRRSGREPFFASAAVTDSDRRRRQPRQARPRPGPQDGQRGLDVPDGRQRRCVAGGGRRPRVRRLAGRQALRARSWPRGRRCTHYELDGGVTGSPAVAAGRLLVGTEKGTLVLFRGEEVTNAFWTAARARMMLDPTTTNLNTGSFGPLPRVVFERVTELRQRLAAEPMDFLVRGLPPLLWTRASGWRTSWAARPCAWSSPSTSPPPSIWWPRRCGCRPAKSCDRPRVRRHALVAGSGPPSARA